MKRHIENYRRVFSERGENIEFLYRVVPVFISCKNGVLTSDELYKLNTVANRFGGKYAKKFFADRDKFFSLT